MQLSELKKSLIGYKKDQVYQYIDSLNAEFSERLSKTEADYEKRLAALEAENEALRQKSERIEQENMEYRKSCSTIADSILDAKRYAEQSRSETRRQETEARDELKKTYERGKKEALAYLDAVEDCRRHISEQLALFNHELSESQLALSQTIRRGVKESDALMEAKAESTASDDTEQDVAALPYGDERFFLFRRKEEKHA